MYGYRHENATHAMAIADIGLLDDIPLTQKLSKAPLSDATDPGYPVF